MNTENILSYLQNIYVIPILIFSVVVHEVAHGWVAYKFGDNTAKDLGRLTLNPLPHIDIVGSILIPLFSLLATGRVFIGWAKPVPVNPNNFENVKKADNLVTAAGPISNLIVGFFCTLMVLLIYYITLTFKPAPGSVGLQFLNYLINMFYVGITLNVSLAVFNMLPIPPLDGSHIFANMLPDNLANSYRRIGFFGIFIILILFNYVPGFTRVFIDIISFVSQPYFSIISLIKE